MDLLIVVQLSFIIIWDALWLHSLISVQVTNRSHMICQSESNDVIGYLVQQPRVVFYGEIIPT